MAKDQQTVFLPVLERELRVQARKKLTYHLRWMTAAAALLLGGALWLAFSNTPIAGGSGKQVFYILSFFGILFSLIEGVRLACDSISKETREGTLGLLFLTDLKEYEIILGKVGACSLSAFYALLAALPVLGISLLLGGLMFGELFRVGLVMVVSLFYSISLSLFISSRSKEESRSLAGASLAVGMMTIIGPFILGTLLPKSMEILSWWISPFAAFGSASDGDYRATPLLYWSQIAVLLILSAGCLALATRKLRTTWMTEKSLTADRKKRHPFWLQSRVSMGASANPIYDLAAQRHVHGLWLVFGAVFYLYIVSSMQTGGAAFLMPLSFMVFKSVIGWKACVDFQKARQCGALELWLTSPLTVQEIIFGKRMAMNRWLLGGLLLMIGASLLYWFQLMLTNTSNDRVLFYAVGTFGENTFTGFSTVPFDANIHNLKVLALLGVVFLFDSWAMIWLGMWQGLSSRGIVQAAAKTFYWIILLPWLVLFIPQIVMMFSGSIDIEGHAMQVVVTILTIIFDIALVVYAKRQLNRRFREVAAEIFVRKPTWWERVFNRVFKKAATAGAE